MIELACPESCQYLEPAREQAIEREREMRAKDQAFETKIVPPVERRLVPLILGIESAILRTQRKSARDLQDSEVQQALENALKNLETESSGLIYEHRTPLLRVQELSEAIRAVPEWLAKESSMEYSFTRTDTVTALKYIQYRIETQMRRSEKETRSYIRSIALFHPWSEETRSARLIV